MNPIILPPAMGKYSKGNSRADWALYLWFGNQSRRRLNSDFKPVRLKIDLKSHPARAVGLDKYMHE